MTHAVPARRTDSHGPPPVLLAALFGGASWLPVAALGGGSPLLAAGVGATLACLARALPGPRSRSVALLWLLPAAALHRLPWAIDRTITLAPPLTPISLWATCAGAGVLAAGLGWRRSRPVAALGGVALALTLLPLLQPHELALAEIAGRTLLAALAVASVTGPLRAPCVAALTVAGGAGLALLPSPYEGLRWVAGSWLGGGGLWWALELARRTRRPTPAGAKRWAALIVGPLLVAAGLATGPTEGHVMDRLQGWTDVDGDGFGLGRGDCAPWNGERHPGAHERPGEGADENCLAGAAPEETGWLRALESKVPPPAPWSGDVVLVVVDSLRADVATPDRHPTWAELSGRGTTYEQAYATSSFTATSLPGILAGLLPSSVALDWQSPLRAYLQAPVVGLPQRLRAEGFVTGFAGGFSDQESGYFRADNFGAGFDVRRPVASGAPADAIADEAARAWAALDRTRRRFLYVHWMTAHEYRPATRDAYEARVQEVAAAIARLRDALGRQALWVVTSDHGEEFGEHGGAFHGRTLYEEVVRVPLYVHRPDMEPTSVSVPVSLRSVMPTVVKMVAQQSTPEGPGPYLCRTDSACPTLPIPLGLEVPTRHLHGLRLGRFKLLRAPDTGRWEAFDLIADPAEQAPLPKAPPDLWEALQGWEEQALSPGARDTFWPYDVGPPRGTLTP